MPSDVMFKNVLQSDVVQKYIDAASSVWKNKTKFKSYRKGSKT